MCVRLWESGKKRKERGKQTNGERRKTKVHKPQSGTVSNDGAMHHYTNSSLFQITVTAFVFYDFETLLIKPQCNWIVVVIVASFYISRLILLINLGDGDAYQTTNKPHISVSKQYSAKMNNTLVVYYTEVLVMRKFPLSG